MIYFIQAEDGGPIKIGTTIRLSERLKTLVREVGGNLRVLAIVDGTYDREKELHERFSHLRSFGEWFEPGDDLLGFIVQDGREWDGSDDVSDTLCAVKISRSLLEKAKLIAAYKGVSMAVLISDLLRAPLNHEYAKMLRDLAASEH